MNSNVYSLGVLLRHLTDGGWADKDAAARVSSNILCTFVPAIERATRAGVEARAKLTPLMDAIGDFPAALNAEEWGDFWLGFYQGGGLQGGGLKTDGLTERFEMKLSPDQKAWVLDNGGAAKVRELIDKDRAAS